MQSVCSGALQLNWIALSAIQCTSLHLLCNTVNYCASISFALHCITLYRASWLLKERARHPQYKYNLAQWCHGSYAECHAVGMWAGYCRWNTTAAPFKFEIIRTSHCCPVLGSSIPCFLVKSRFNLCKCARMIAEFKIIVQNIVRLLLSLIK
jgi:hypothetical protein